MTATISAITLLADRPELAVGWAELHWREWGDEPGREELSWWVEAASQAIQRTSVPVAFIALGHDGEVLGGVGLSQFDLEERRDRSPWIVGMIVRADLRDQGIGQALMARLGAWAITVGIEQVWVCTEREGRAAAFYQHCGYARVENLITRGGRGRWHLHQETHARPTVKDLWQTAGSATRLRSSPERARDEIGENGDPAQEERCHSP